MTQTLKRILPIFLCLILLAGCKSQKDISESSSVSSEAFIPTYTSSFEEPVFSSDAESSAEASSAESTASKASSIQAAPSRVETIAPPSPPPQVAETNKAETKAIWISFLEYQEILKGKSESEFSKSIDEYFNTCVLYGFNTVITQVRSHGDAFYKSSYFPASSGFTKVRQNSFPFDPLKIMVEKAHERGLKIEAWVNPYRGNKIEWEFAENDVVKRYLDLGLAFEFGEYYYFNPAEPEIKNLILNGIIEIVENYDIDGIHFDDYFYPDTDQSIDAVAYEKYGNGRTLSQFRTDCINDLISSVYKEIKLRKNITFGISPAGNISTCVNSHYADVVLWGSTEGYIDYIAPQLYWSYGEGELPYDVALQSWKSIVTNSNVKLIVGLTSHKITDNKLDVWKTGDILMRQVIDAKKLQNYNGFIVFRYSHFFSDIMKTERDNLKSVI